MEQQCVSISWDRTIGITDLNNGETFSTPFVLLRLLLLLLLLMMMMVMKKKIR